jgi:hypothetical protein
MRCKTKFTRGDADESFVWRITGQDRKLIGYHVSSPLLIIDREPGTLREVSDHYRPTASPVCPAAAFDNVGTLASAVNGGWCVCQSVAR